MDFKKGHYKTLKTYINCKWGFAEDRLEVYENCAEYLRNNLILNEISILIFFQFNCKIETNQLKIVAEATFGLHLKKYFEILTLKFGGKSLLTRLLELHSDSWLADEIRDFPILIDFCT